MILKFQNLDFRFRLSDNPLNEDLRKYIDERAKNHIIMDDLNAKNTRWHCKNNDTKGKKLETIIDELNLYIINNKTPTYRSSGNVIGKN